MQSPRSLHIPSFHASFPKHNSEYDWPRFPHQLKVSTNVPAPYWASLPSPPMSGSPPSEDPLEPPQLAGRRRKRSSTPPTPRAIAAVPLEQSSGQGATGRPYTQARSAPVSTTAAAAVVPYPSPYPSAQTYGYGSAGPSLVDVTATAPETQPGPGDISARATRKTKAHVASACMNCKKKHLRCDNARPCRRCVQSGKEVSYCR